MPITALHVKTLTVADSSDTGIVRPTDWNSSHNITFNAVGSELIGAFSNGGNVSFGTDTGGFVTASAPVGGGAAIKGSGTYTQNSGTIQFANSNNITFGLSSDGVMTASYSNTVPYITTAMASNAGSNFIAASAGTNATGSIGISLASNAVSVSIPAFLTTAQPVGAYLTTARASTDAIGLNSALTANGVSMTANSSGLSLNFPAFLTTAQPVGAYLTTAMASNAGSNFVGLNSALTANGVSASINSSGISLNFPAFLTTAALSGDTSKYAGVSTGTQSTAGVVPTLTHNTAGLNIGVPAWITTYVNDLTSGRAGTSTGTQSTAGAVPTLTLNTAGLNLGVPAWLTTAALSGDTTKYAGVSSGTQSTAGVAPTLTLNTAGLNLGIPAWITTAMASNRGTDFVQASAAFNGTNVSGTIASNAISISVAGPQAGVGIAAGTRTATTAGNILFDTGNGITFGLNVVGGSVMTASHNGLTTAMASNRGTDFVQANAAFNGTNASGTIASNGISVSVGNYITTARASTDAIGLNSALTANGVSMTANSSGLSLNFPAFLTTAAQVSHSHGNPTLALTNMSGTTASNSAGLTLSLSVAAPGGGAAVNVSAGTTSGNLQTIQFSDLNGVSFGLNGSTITASHNGLTTAAQVSHSHGNPTLALTNLAGTTASASNGFTLSLNNVDDHYKAYSLVGNTAGTNVSTITTVGTMYLSGGNNITLSGNSNTIVISAPNAPASSYGNRFEPFDLTSTAGVVSSGILGLWNLQPFELPFAISGGRLNFLAQGQNGTANVFVPTAANFASNTTGTKSQAYTYDHRVALYSQGTGTNSTRLESFWSNSFSFGWSNSLIVSVTGGANSVSVSMTNSLSYIADIDVSGGIVASQFTTSGSSGFGATSGNSTAFISVGNSLRSMLTGGFILPIGFNTTLSPGNYWLANAWSFTRTSSRTNAAGMASGGDFVTQNLFGMSNAVQSDLVSFKNFGSSITNARSQYFGIVGTYTGAANMDPPQYIAISSDVSIATQYLRPYFNYQVRGLTK